MTQKIFWRLFISALMITYAVISMMPLKSTPFRDYVESHATADKTELSQILKEADERVANYRNDAIATAQKSPTAYTALKDILDGKGKSGKPIELAKFFPDIKMVNEPVQTKRNQMLMQELLRRSQGKIKLGLDLQGGISFTLKVNPEAAKAETKLLEKAKTEKEREEIRIAAKNRAKEKLSQLNQSITVMEGRVNNMGVGEPIIRPLGNDTIEIQLPGEDTANNPEAINSLKKPAKLEFRQVHRYARPNPSDPEGKIVSLKDNPNLAASPVAPYEVLYNYHIDPKTGTSTAEPLYIKKAPDATGAIVNKAYPTQQGYGIEVGINFTSDGSKRFGDITKRIADRDNAGEPEGRFAIVLDGKLMSAPTINASAGGKKTGIFGGRASITGNFDQKEANELAQALNNPLEFPLELQDMTNVGASLAADAKTQSINASIVGTIFVILFMVVFYLYGGIIAIIGIAVNILMVLGIMCAMGATITLPGIAALVLTIGMAVDANILVYERMREELAAGKSLRTAVQLGYERAFVTILDSQLTTLLVAFILIFMGTGSVKGFGVTLAIGIITTLLTTLITCRGLQELCTELNLFKQPFGIQLIKLAPKYHFMKHWKKSTLISIIIIGIGVGSIFYRGGDCLSKDFKGGESITLKIVQDEKIQNKVGVGEILKVARNAGIKDASAVYQQKVGAAEKTLSIECELTKDKSQGEFSNINKIASALKTTHPELFPANAKTIDDIIIGKSAVGATVSSQLITSTIIALALAILGIMVYVALRFEVGFGIGAMVSTIHDIIAITGVYLAMGGQMTASMIAAVLMAAGYSINDTIVVFDRIREELAKHPSMKLSDVIDLSINLTLSRTLMTSVTVFLTAVSLAYFGAGEVAEYGKVFIWAVIIGTFSSIFIASPIYYWWHRGDRKRAEEGDKEYVYSWDAGNK